MKNPIKRMNLRQTLARFGLEPLRSTGRVVGTGATLLGIGAAVGVGTALLLDANRRERLLSRFRRQGSMDGADEAVSATH